jgi:hypothetical protein
MLAAHHPQNAGKRMSKTSDASSELKWTIHLVYLDDTRLRQGSGEASRGRPSIEPIRSAGPRRSLAPQK